MCKRILFTSISLLLTFSCEDIFNDMARKNPLDLESDVKLSITLADTNYRYEFGDKFTMRLTNLVGNDGKTYNHLIKNVQWNIAGNVDITENITYQTSINKLGVFQVFVDVVLKNGDLITNESRIEVVPITSTVKVINPTQAKFEYFQDKKFDFTIVDKDSIEITNLKSIQWESSLDGILSNEKSFTVSNLRAGVHLISLSITLEDNTVKSKDFEIIINEIPLQFSITSPDTTIVYKYEESINFNSSISYKGNNYIPTSISWYNSSGTKLSSLKDFTLNNPSYSGKHTYQLKFQSEDKIDHDTTITVKTIFPGQFHDALDPIILSKNFTFSRFNGKKNLAVNNIYYELSAQLEIVSQEDYPSYPSDWGSVLKFDENYISYKNTQSTYNGDHSPLIIYANLNKTELWRHYLRYNGTSPYRLLIGHRVVSINLDKISNNLIIQLKFYRPSTFTDVDNVIFTFDLNGQIKWVYNTHPYLDISRTRAISNTVFDNDHNIFLMARQDLIKLDDNGNHIKTFSIDSLLGVNFASSKLIYEGNNLFLIGNPYSDLQLFFLKLNTNLDIINFSKHNYPKKTSYTDIKRLDDAIYAYTSWEISKFEKDNFATIYSVTLNGIEEFKFRDKIIDSNNNSIILGENGTVVKISDSGSKIWEFNLTRFNDMKFNFIFEVNNHYRIVGSILNTRKSLYYIDISKDGDVLNYH